MSDVAGANDPREVTMTSIPSSCIMALITSNRISCYPILSRQGVSKQGNHQRLRFPQKQQLQLSGQVHLNRRWWLHPSTISPAHLQMTTAQASYHQCYVYQKYDEYLIVWIKSTIQQLYFSINNTHIIADMLFHNFLAFNFILFFNGQKHLSLAFKLFE